MLAEQEFKNAMSLLSSAVTVVTTAGESGRYGFTASAVCSLSASPPTLLVCMNKGSYLHSFFVANRVLSVNLLAAEHQALSEVFASKLGSDERFARAQWTQLVTGAPILKDALASFDCQIEQIQQVATHDIFICRILALQTNARAEGQPRSGLAYFARGYHALGQASAALDLV